MGTAGGVWTGRPEVYVSCRVVSPRLRTIRPVAKGRKQAPSVPGRPSSSDPHAVVFFKRHADDDPQQRAPGYDFLSTCPTKVRATMYAVLTAVAAAPPKRYAGGGYWEAMHGDMTGGLRYALTDRTRAGTTAYFAVLTTTLKVRTVRCLSVSRG